ncbi:TPA: polyphenol oxidase family protein [Pseudomonas aeruginosa]|uniref:polyphenol oxidase family protein n=1 Tax=Pseudomonas aeruginosa TaxID=287 RepID=UPI000F53B5A3|nr:laccase domain-containing protein [Pseudomonas aeruginosa]EKV4568573.1 laccase domain-containing protein [Pseudomonas aeruginosa]MBU8390397.1 laccase domain-containing protein [Pseudomonas aeruginosa]MCV4360263.1 laccase domain-containing protein [Pseudomonas aeruginosa]MCW3884184.1 laccase domain-containing protein [Pseudomonas aeruginosa]RPM88725.1 hypothetical protein IPC1280_08410 [Pseudomonas aeruginosa]
MTVQADILKAIEGVEHGFQEAGQALSERIFHCRQVHGAEIVDARSLSESGRHAADGVFSEGSLAVAVVTADCLPILMSSSDGRVVAALHGGWQGLVAGIVGAAVARFNARGVASADIRVAIGPGIKACCYEVSAGFIEALQVGHGRLWEGAVPPWSQRRPLPERPPRFAPPEPRQAGQGAWLDLVAFCRQLFQAAGVGPAQIEASAVCTYCSGDAFASHRRRQRLGEEKRQQYAWIARKP